MVLVVLAWIVDRMLKSASSAASETAAAVGIAVERVIEAQAPANEVVQATIQPAVELDEARAWAAMVDDEPNGLEDWTDAEDSGVLEEIQAFRSSEVRSVDANIPQPDFAGEW